MVLGQLETQLIMLCVIVKVGNGLPKNKVRHSVLDLHFAHLKAIISFYLVDQGIS